MLLFRGLFLEEAVDLYFYRMKLSPFCPSFLAKRASLRLKHRVEERPILEVQQDSLLLVFDALVPDPTPSSQVSVVEVHLIES